MLLGILNACVPVLCVVHVVDLSSLFFYGFDMWSVQRLYFSILLVVFNISIASFLLLHVSLLCSQMHILIVTLSMVQHRLHSPCENLVFSSKIFLFPLRFLQ